MATLGNIQLSGNARLSREACRDCGKYFVYYPQNLPSGEAPKRCPRCKDVYQGRPSVVEGREEVAFYEAVEVKNLPAQWVEYTPAYSGDIGCWLMVVKGKDFGADWKGRIDIFAPRAISPGEVVNIRDMETTHRVKVVSETRQTLHHGEVAVEHEVPLDYGEGTEVMRKRRYLVLEPTTPGTEPKSRLVWATAYTKTTIKGLGRQFWSKIEGSSIAEWRITGGVRSGRAHTTGVLAIVDANHPIVASTTGDYQGKKIYN